MPRAMTLRSTFGAHHDLVARLVEMFHAHVLGTLARGEQRSLVDQVRQVRAGEAGRAARDGLEVDIRR